MAAGTLPDVVTGRRPLRRQQARTSPAQPSPRCACSGAGQNDPDVQEGVDYLESVDPDRWRRGCSEGGFLSFGSSNANSTGWAVSGLNACGIDPQSADFTTSRTASPRSTSCAACRRTVPGPTTEPSTTTSATASRSVRTSARPRTRSGRWPARPSRPSRRPAPAPASRPRRTPARGGRRHQRADRAGRGRRLRRRHVLPRDRAQRLVAGHAAGHRQRLQRARRLRHRWRVHRGPGQQAQRPDRYLGDSRDRGAEQVAPSQTVRFGDFVALRRVSRAVPRTRRLLGGGGTRMAERPRPRSRRRSRPGPRRPAWRRSP